MWDLKHGLGISALPTRSSLRLFKTLGFTDLVNVSGSATENLYLAADLDGLAFSDYPFADVLSTAGAVTEIVEKLGPAGLLEFKKAATQTASCLQQQRRVIVFCHLGVGRSPAVSTIALMLGRGYSLDEAVDVIVKLRPEAVLSDPVVAFVQRMHAELVSAA